MYLRLSSSRAAPSEPRDAEADETMAEEFTDAQGTVSTDPQEQALSDEAKYPGESAEYLDLLALLTLSCGLHSVQPP